MVAAAVVIQLTLGWFPPLSFCFCILICGLRCCVLMIHTGRVDMNITFFPPFSRLSHLSLRVCSSLLFLCHFSLLYLDPICFVFFLSLLFPLLVFSFHICIDLFLTPCYFCVISLSFIYPLSIPYFVFRFSSTICLSHSYLLHFLLPFCLSPPPPLFALSLRPQFISLPCY